MTQLVSREKIKNTINTDLQSKFNRGIESLVVHATKIYQEVQKLELLLSNVVAPKKEVTVAVISAINAVSLTCNPS